MKVNVLERRAVIGSAVMALMLLIAQPSYAMHISEGFLPPGWCIFWWALYIPFFVWGIIVIKKKCAGNGRIKLLLAMSAAYCFILSALKIPSVTGSSSHPTGVGLGTVVFGPAAMSVLGFIVLIFQALLIAHGGLTTLGANAFSMAVAGPFAGYGAFILVGKLTNSKPIQVFSAAFIADLFTYMVTSVQLALAFNSVEVSFTAALVKFMTIFAITQIPLAIVEGILTVLIYNAVSALCQDELQEFSMIGGSKKVKGGSVS